jgi:hypothetical protein
MNNIRPLPFLAIAVAGAIACIAPATKESSEESEQAPAGDTDRSSSPYMTEIPEGYRDWRFVSLAREEGTLEDIRVVLGNDTAIEAYRGDEQPFPEGTVIARLAYSYDESEENNATFGRKQSYVAGHPKNGLQFMVKDSVAYAASGGWGYGHFVDGKPADEAMMKTCFGCHQAVAERDFVFTRYSP